MREACSTRMAWQAHQLMIDHQPQVPAAVRPATYSCAGGMLSGVLSVKRGPGAYQASCFHCSFLPFEL